MKKPEPWRRFDVVEDLATEADMVAYLQAALEDGACAKLRCQRATSLKNSWFSVTKCHLLPIKSGRAASINAITAITVDTRANKRLAVVLMRA